MIILCCLEQEVLMHRKRKVDRTKERQVLTGNFFFSSSQLRGLYLMGGSGQGIDDDDDPDARRPVK
jgi:hypothetical protein